MTSLVHQFEVGPGYFSEPMASGLQTPEDWFFEALTFGSASDSGERVNPVAALGHGPVWQAVNILAGDVGQLPWHKMKRTGTDGRGAEKDRDHPLEWLINDQPNPYQTPSVWRETMMAWALLWGNGVSAIHRGTTGERELIPLRPDCVSCEAGGSEGHVIIYRPLAGGEISFNPSEVFHVRGLATDGFWGQSAVKVARDVIGHGMALQKHGNRVFKNGARPSGVLEHPGRLDTPARTNLRNEWNAIHSGADNAGKIAILYEGMKFSAMSMSNEDAQWLEARRLDREFIASLFGLPAFKLNALEHSAVRANLEEQNRDYFNTSLARWLNRFNEEACRKLLSMRERKSREHFFRWYPEGFLRGDIQKRYAAYSQAITARFMNPNEVREREDMNPYDGGDEYLNPAIDQAAGSEPDGSNGDPPPDGEGKDVASALVRQRVEALLDGEAKAIEKACNSDANLTKWADSYYENYTKAAEYYLDLACKLACSAGCGRCDWRTASDLHARDGLNRLLARAGIVTKADLPTVGSELAASIREQRDYFIASILGVN